MIPVRIALANLSHARLRTGASVLGVAFAVLLIFMQFGFLGSVQTAATLLYDHLDFDLILLPGEYREMLYAGSLSRYRLVQARYVSGVESVQPVWLTIGMWQDPRAGRPPENLPPRRWNILIVGVDPAQLRQVFREADGGVFPPPGGEPAAAAALRRQDVVLLDRRSWPLYGDAQDRRPGSTTELNDRRVTIGGAVHIGTGFGYNGLVVTSDLTYADLTGHSLDRASFALVKVAEGADVARVRRDLAALAPHEILVRSRPELVRSERHYWEQSTSVGLFFKAGAVIAFVGGLLFVLQMMVGDILSRIREFATLKAMGYGDFFLARVVVWQALLLSLLGYAVGWLASAMAYRVVSTQARIPIEMNLERAGFVFGLAVVMCLAAGAVAVFKLRAADPAELF